MSSAGTTQGHTRQAGLDFKKRTLALLHEQSSKLAILWGIQDESAITGILHEYDATSDYGDDRIALAVAWLYGVNLLIFEETANRLYILFASPSFQQERPLWVLKFQTAPPHYDPGCILDWRVFESHFRALRFLPWGASLNLRGGANFKHLSSSEPSLNQPPMVLGTSMGAGLACLFAQVNSGAPCTDVRPCRSSSSKSQPNPHTQTMREPQFGVDSDGLACVSSHDVASGSIDSHTMHSARVVRSSLDLRAKRNFKRSVLQASTSSACRAVRRTSPAGLHTKRLCRFSFARRFQRNHRRLPGTVQTHLREVASGELCSSLFGLATLNVGALSAKCNDLLCVLWGSDVQILCLQEVRLTSHAQKAIETRLNDDGWSVLWGVPTPLKIVSRGISKAVAEVPGLAILYRTGLKVCPHPLYTEPGRRWEAMGRLMACSLHLAEGAPWLLYNVYAPSGSKF
eukprot:149047-Amphidinium_carterae.2